MIKQYDDFTKMKPKEMCKTISDMTYTYLNPETNEPTVVPASHYEKILNQVKEQFIAESTRKIFLNTMYLQLKAIKDEEPKLFQQALICLDLGMKPNDLRVEEEIALFFTQDMLEEKEKMEKKNYHLIDSDVIDYFNAMKNDKKRQAEYLNSPFEDSDDMEVEVNITF